MTNQEINMMIAGIKGIPVTVIKDEVFFAVAGWPGGCGKRIDYINDWNLLGPLMLELGRVGWHWKASADMLLGEEGRYRWFNPLKFSPATLDTDFGRATCLAYIEEFG